MLCIEIHKLYRDRCNVWEAFNVQVSQLCFRQPSSVYLPLSDTGVFVWPTLFAYSLFLVTSTTVWNISVQSENNTIRVDWSLHLKAYTTSRCMCTSGCAIDILIFGPRIVFRLFFIKCSNAEYTIALVYNNSSSITAAPKSINWTVIENSLHNNVVSTITVFKTQLVRMIAV